MDLSIEEKVNSLMEWRNGVDLVLYGDEKKGIPSMVQTARMIERIVTQLEGLRTIAAFLGVTNVATVIALITYIIRRGGF